MRRSRRFRKRKSRLGRWLALRFVLPRLRRPCTLEPACGDRDISYPRNFRDRLQVVDRLLAPIGSYVPFALKAKRSILGQTDEHAVRLFDELGRIAPGPLENVVEGRAQMLVVLSRLVVQEFISNPTRTPGHAVGPSLHG
jgi:hypothetical protein